MSQFLCHKTGDGWFYFNWDLIVSFHLLCFKRNINCQYFQIKCIWAIYTVNDILRQINQDDNWDWEKVTGGRVAERGGGLLPSKHRRESKVILLVVNLSLSLVWLWWIAGDTVQTLHILPSFTENFLKFELLRFQLVTTDSRGCIIINWEKDKLEMSKYLSYLINILSGRRKHADLVLKPKLEATNNIYRVHRPLRNCN